MKNEKYKLAFKFTPKTLLLLLFTLYFSFLILANGKFGWGGRIRTYEMSESESDALPLGDTPMYKIYFINLV